MRVELEVIFKDTSWTEILHVKAEFITFLHKWTVSRHLKEKQLVSMFNFLSKAPKFNEVKVGFYIKNLSWQWWWGDGYTEKIKKSGK